MARTPADPLPIRAHRLLLRVRDRLEQEGVPVRVAGAVTRQPYLGTAMDYLDLADADREWRAAGNKGGMVEGFDGFDVDDTGDTADAHTIATEAMRAAFRAEPTVLPLAPLLREPVRGAPDRVFYVPASPGAPASYALPVGTNDTDEALRLWAAVARKLARRVPADVPRLVDAEPWIVTLDGDVRAVARLDREYQRFVSAANSGPMFASTPTPFVVHTDRGGAAVTVAGYTARTGVLGSPVVAVGRELAAPFKWVGAKRGDTLQSAPRFASLDGALAYVGVSG
jgi:hypothetical protein